MQLIVEKLARHCLTGVGGALVAAGYLTDSQAGEVIGTLLLIGGKAWSLAPIAISIYGTWRERRAAKRAA